MRSLIPALLASTVMVASAAHAQTTVAQTTVTQSGYAPLYLGVDQETATIQVAGVTSRATIVRADLTAPGIAFVTTPAAGPQGSPGETLTQFAAAEHVQIAINGNFFSRDASGNEAVIGLQVSQGHVVAPPNYDAGNSSAVLTLTRTNQASIVQPVATTPLDLSSVYTAVAGSAIVVANGQDATASNPPEGDPTDPNPRSLIGLSKTGRFLYFVAIDGRIPGYTTGTTNAGSAALMIAIGADRALNLDGGGSTEIVRADPGQAPYILTNPSGQTQRVDISAIGFTALPLPSQALLNWQLIDRNYFLLQQLLRSVGLGG